GNHASLNVGEWLVGGLECQTCTRPATLSANPKSTLSAGYFWVLLSLSQPPLRWLLTRPTRWLRMSLCWREPRISYYSVLIAPAAWRYSLRSAAPHLC